MDIFKGLSRLCSHFHQDVVIEYGTFENAIAHAGDCLTDAERPLIKAFLTTELKSKRGRMRLHRICKGSQSGWHIQGGIDTSCYLFEEIRKRL